MEEATAYFYSHLDCPHCGEETQVEGDVREQVIECDHCGEEFKAV
jgi:transcription elongation factor Elf1